MVNNYLPIHLPKRLTNSFISSYIGKINVIFQYKNTGTKTIALDFGDVQEIDILGTLITYKVLEYCMINNCFANKIHNIFANDNLVKEIQRFGFDEFINSLTVVEEKKYKKLKVELLNNCVVAPIALLRRDSAYSEEMIQKKYEPTISKYYAENEKKAGMILEVFTEIMHNFWSHASDNKSIIAGFGNKAFFEIACADNGLGIDGTMAFQYPNKTGLQRMKLAMKRGITSKTNTNHMGFGLWFINEIVNRTKGILTIISNGILFQNRFGSMVYSACPKWEGTIVYVKLPLEKPVTISEIEDTRTIININFI